MRAFLDRAGIADDVEALKSIDDVHAWKLRPTRSRWSRCTHGIFGAREAGLTTGSCPRLEAVPTPMFGAADVVDETLDAVVTGLTALPEGPT